MDCFWHGRRLAFGADWAAELPAAVQTVLKQGSGSEYLQTLSELALDPRWTLRVCSKFEPLLVELCNRWLRNDDTTGKIDFNAFCAISRLLTLHPQLGQYASEIALSRRRGVFQQLGPEGSSAYLESIPEDVLGALLLSIYRCLRHDRHAFSLLFNGPQIQALFQHERAHIRYLAVKIWASYLSAADAAFQDAVARRVPQGPANGTWDHIEIDFRYLDLWEKRLHGLYFECQETPLDQISAASQGRNMHASDLLPSTVVIGGTPQPSATSQLDIRSLLVCTPTTQRNLQKLGTSLVRRTPILLTGLPGSGKSSLVQDASRIYGKDQSMLTLHLNEQTDAKLLIGMYTSAGSPGSFKWQPGVLTTAVREGRWALIEDLDRAPAEVMSTLLPLMERRQLYVPNLGGSITAHPGFRLFATIRSSTRVNGSQEMTTTPHFLGARHWHRVHVEPLSDSDLRAIIAERYPLLQSWSSRLLQTYESLLSPSSFARVAERKTGVSRSLGPRDLFKCCQRISQLLIDSGARTGAQPASELLQDHIFLEIVDCFAGFAQSVVLRDHVTKVAAQILEVSPQRREHCLRSRAPTKDSTEKYLRIGRIKLNKRKSQGIDRQHTGNKQPFAYTDDVLRKMEVLAATVRSREPCLLVGETGTGKTTAVQELAKAVGQKLTVVNLSQQSEAGDLLGGFKPATLRSLSAPMKDNFGDLFQATVPVDENRKFGQAVDRAFKRGEYEKLVKLWRRAVDMVKSKLPALKVLADDNPAKRRKTNSSEKQRLRAGWDNFSQSLNILEMHVKSGGKGFAFHFVEGNIVKAVRNGEWVLLDEINLASPDTLESLADLLTNDPAEQPSLLLTETGDVERVLAHPDFRIFAAMNPATDVGKRDLPLSLRTRFTEFYISSPDRDPNSLCQIVEACLGTHTHNVAREAKNITNLYLEIVKLEEENKLVDGANQRPHYSLRTLTRTLAYVLEIAPLYGLTRSLFEGFSMSFLTLLNRASANLVSALIEKYVLPEKRDRKSIFRQTPNPPNDNRDYVRFEHYWLRKGELEVGENPRYIITSFIHANLLNLVRAASSRRFPVLLQGPTSSGKTSMVEYLAKISGNTFVRINNHEHTDLQEYLGTYVTDNEGNLSFQEGVLVQALRKGHWIVLDELNLAPTDILEALNRLLDDNRELFIPETQETIRPHENFMLFATQNPAGLYGGRKALSRAFRNRFLELHFDDIPESELETILTRRTQIAPSHAAIIIKIYRKLAELRQSSRLFEQKGSFATLRDLFRWALRNITTKEELAQHGYMLLAERVRNEDEREAVRNAIHEVTKIRVDPNCLYSASNVSSNMFGSNGFAHDIVWTPSMCRIYVLVTEALKRNEPVLLVGGTGCGKTSICQVIAEMAGTELNIVNAHQNTETGDLIGAQRPIRNRSAIESELRANILSLLHRIGQELHNNKTTNELIAMLEEVEVEALESDQQPTVVAIRDGLSKWNALFEWSDGSLVQAMKKGTHFLLDEISLAEDSVLERLNSVLESGRTILLAEKGPEDSSITAANGFQFLATMNPGGDFGKRELSPALRNRFTEIWVPPMSSQEEIAQIAKVKLTERFKSLASNMVAFAFWFGESFYPAGPALSIRDVLAWVEFLNTCSYLDIAQGIVEGAAMVYIDALGANPAAGFSLAPSAIHDAKQKSLDQLSEIFQHQHDMARIYFAARSIRINDDQLNVGDFSLSRKSDAEPDQLFSFQAPTTIVNLSRVVRALQLKKPLLLEGSPGVGKTTLVAALAAAVGMPLTRINLSEQTDLMDIFGSDVPVEGGEAGQFAWRDAPFLQAMKRGEWVLLDEMNLASQSVLEGLNACLDHRGEVFIPELDQTFRRHPEFTIFAAQNPHSQGGGRKGLPASFVNRFTVVYADAFSRDDLLTICKERFPEVEEQIVKQVIDYVVELGLLTQSSPVLSASGGPWEFNLRDILRWLGLISDAKSPTSFAESSYFKRMLFLQRFRSKESVALAEKQMHVQSQASVATRSIYRNLSASKYQAGLALLERTGRSSFSHVVGEPENLPVLESVMIGVMQQWPVLLVGSSGSGKTSLLRHLAAMTGNELLELPLSADMDTMDIVGGYEQADPQRLLNGLQHSFREALKAAIVEDSLPASLQRWSLLENETPEQSPFTEIEAFLKELTSATQKPERIWDHIFTQCSEVRQRLSQDMRARFEWSDGMLIQALETGKWLVLDNSNLCSSSVLDRLNSLMEPNGFLAINEHRMPDGSARIIRPHRDFRLFLTMDPRHGELSRAMRNRCLELYMPESSAEKVSIPSSDLLDSSLFRFQPLVKQAWSRVDAGIAESLLTISFDGLGFYDQDLLGSLPQQLDRGLLPAPQIASEILHKLVDHDVTGLQQSTAFKSSTLETYRECFSVLGYDAENLANTESIHPMNNTMLLSIAQKIRASTITPQHLATLSDLWHHVHQLLFRLTVQKQKLIDGSVKASSRLDRSLVADRVLAFSKDATAPLAGVLYQCLKALSTMLREQTGQALSRNDLHLLHQCTYYFVDLFDIAREPSLDDAKFQTYLSIGARLFRPKKATEALQPLLESLVSQLANFKSQWQLQTGLGMKQLWAGLRSQGAHKSSQKELLYRLEGLLAHLSRILIGTALPYSSLAEMKRQIVHVYRQLFTDELKTEPAEQILASIDEFLASLPPGNESYVQHFQRSFQGIAQLIELQTKACHVSETLELATCRPLQASLYALHATNFAEQLHSVQLATGILWDEQPLAAVRQTVMPVLASQLCTMDKVSMGALTGLHNELLELPLALAEICKASSQDPTKLLNQQILKLHTECYQIFASWTGSNFTRTYTAQLQGLRQRHSAETISFDASISQDVATLEGADQIGAIFDESLSASLEHLSNLNDTSLQGIRSTAAAWINFFTGSLLLYIPDKPFDPALESIIGVARYRKRKNELETQAKALSEYEDMKGYPQLTPRIQMIQDALAALGDEPHIIGTFRPEQSRLSQLGGEFTNILNSIVKHCKSMTFDKPDAVQVIRGVARNTEEVITRLHASYRDYDDIIQPAVQLLTGLRLGLELAMVATEQHQAHFQLSKPVRVCMPTIGMSRTGMLSISTKDFQKKGMNHHHEQMLYLQAVGVESKIVGTIDSQYLRVVQQILDDFYSSWRKNLEKEQDVQATKSSLYRYQGADNEEHDEELTAADIKQLFPSYDDNQTPQHGPHETLSTGPSHLAKRIAGLHGAIFNSHSSPQSAFDQLVQVSVQDLAQSFLFKDMSGLCSTSARDFLPTLIHLLQTKTNEVSPAIQRDGRDFYRDANIVEVKKVLELVNRVRTRFEAIHEAWPEQASPMDVIKVIDELMTLPHTDPIAKILTKAEQLHNFVYQWEQVASREFSASSLYTELTDLLVSWRRLELSSWASLLDTEQEACKEDTKAWWFIAYETIIAASLSTISNQEDFFQHVFGLVETLAHFMGTTPIGQFSERLNMIQNFKLHVKALSEQQPRLQQLDLALLNFLAYYRRFQSLIDDKLRSDRQDLDKKMKEVIILSSWKDTNIEALKASSRASHTRLFKIVRKYRSLLAENVAPFLLQEPPFNQDLVLSEIALSSASASEEKLAKLQKLRQTLPESVRLPKHFQNAGHVLTTMTHICQVPRGSVDISSHLRSWLEELISDTAELQKETPSILTEDNKALIQHLKVRKRKVFAEVLKDLRIMGFKTNLDTRTLDAQGSTARILANASAVATESYQLNCDEDFFRVIDNLDKIRPLTRNHSDDLASNEVARSLVYLQGLVDLVIQQRRSLYTTGAALIVTSNVCRQLGALSDSCLAGTLRLDNRAPTSQKHNKAAVKWLPTVFRFSAKLLKLHDHMGGESTRSIQDSLETYAVTMGRISRDTDASTTMPPSLTTTGELQARVKLSETLADLHESLASWDDSCQRASFSTTLIRNWLPDVTHSEQQHDIVESMLSLRFEEKTFKVLDRILRVLEITSKTLDQLPTSAKDNDWLFKSTQVLQNALGALSMDEISSLLRDQLNVVGSVGTDNQAQAAAALCSFMSPFFDAYHQICQSLFERCLSTHNATTKTSRVLSDSFRGLLSNGFCGPKEESKGDKSGQEKLEDGTGLGDGEGAEDISKDIQDDEDLSELAQGKKEDGEENEIEGEDNAVDMADQDLEGKMDEDGEQQDADDEDKNEEDNDDPGPEEELGDVGNDDPEAIDEKLWDGDNKEEDSENQNRGDQKTGKKDDQMAANENNDKQPGGETQDDLSTGEEDAEAGQDINDANMPSVDPHLQEEEKLDLPDDIDMDADQKSIVSESDLDDMDGDEDAAEQDNIDSGKPEGEADGTLDDELLTEEQEPDELQDGQDADMNAESDGENPEPQENPLRDQGDPGQDAEDQVQGDTDGLAGSGETEEQAPEQEQTETGGTQGQSGAKDEAQGLEESADSEQQAGSGNAAEGMSAEDTLQDSAEAQAFKKLGDALERFQRTSKEIRQAQHKEDEAQSDIKNEQEATEFEHLPDNNVDTDDQALGNADDDQAKGLEDGAMDIDQPANEAAYADQTLLNGEDENEDLEKPSKDDPDAMEVDAPHSTTVGQRQPRADPKAEQEDDTLDGVEPEEDIQELDDGLSEVHIQPPVPDIPERSAEDALQLWQECELQTNDLAMSLTEQLRLILAPTLATKMRGDFRTGKRLNIKRIIPYIASQYKRDKIWMRRSIPSKRNYQIMIAVDDSKSMNEHGGGSSQLAFETLALVSRSLSMLEAGQLCVLGFGKDVHVAHSFDQTFSSSAGANILQHFLFEQNTTDVRHLVSESLRLFREARAQNQNTNSELWQIELIISDGICEDHDGIRQLVRQAHQERVMMVFVIVDALKGTSISTLNRASFETNTATGKTELKMERYLADFPFDYYLIVGDVRELPAVLATALRQWFSEIADA